jgi:hypothetical protein
MIVTPLLVLLAVVRRAPGLQTREGRHLSMSMTPVIKPVVVRVGDQPLLRRVRTDSGRLAMTSRQVCSRRFLRVRGFFDG